MGCRGRETRGRHDDKYDMPEGGGHESAAGNPSLHPTVFEEAGGEKGLGDSGPTKNGGDAAADPMVEGSPSDIELRALARIEAHAGGRLGSLSPEIERVAELVQRHFLFASRIDARPDWI